MPEEKPKNEDDPENGRGGQAQEPQNDDRIVDSCLDPDAQSPDDERAKPCDPKENDPG